MKLHLEIKDGERSGHTFSLTSAHAMVNSIPWVKENEAIEFKLVAPIEYECAVLELYEYRIEATRVQKSSEEELVEFYWIPKQIGGFRYEHLFFNYFGLAELTVLLTKRDGSELITFHPLEVLASKMTGDAVEQMFEFLASISGEALHSVFSATRHGVGFEEGSVSPSFTQERLELAAEQLQQKLPNIIQGPITRLVPEQRLISPSGAEELDEGSLGWLLENLHVLSETDNPEAAHLYYDSDLYSARKLQIPVLANNTDLYENQVIHGYVSLLLHEAQSLISQYMIGFEDKTKSQRQHPQGYTSFFTKVARFKNLLVGGQIKRCEALVDSLKHIKVALEKHLPVTRQIRNRPIITPKVRVNHAYRELYIDLIRWHEKGQVDWSAFENLFAIQSVPLLFEAYCYFRTAQILNEHFTEYSSEQNTKTGELETLFIDEVGNELWLRREPIYWMTGHNKSFGDTFVNSEGWTVIHDRIKSRGQTGPNCRRSPDIAIEVQSPNGQPSLILMDAKYTNKNKALSDYLPELTMKYAHGIHHISSGNPVVTSLTILHPAEDGIFRSFHHSEYGVFGTTPVTPNLQCLGVIVGKGRESDLLKQLILQVLAQVGIIAPKDTKVVMSEARKV